MGIESKIVFVVSHTGADNSHSGTDNNNATTAFMLMLRMYFESRPLLLPQMSRPTPIPETNPTQTALVKPATDPLLN